MDSLRKQAGYLEGLLASMKPDETDTASQLTHGMVALLSALTERVEAMDDMLGELNDYVESIDDDLSDLEGMHDDEDADDEFDFSAYPAEGQEPLRLLKNSKQEPRKLYAPVLCPKCKMPFVVEDPDVKHICPHCGKTVKAAYIDERNVPIGEPVED